MAPDKTKDWNPETYARFRGLRLRPALDLLMQIVAPASGDVVDLGCGDGAVAHALRQRFPKRRLVAVDSSAAMLERARGYDERRNIDISEWAPDAPTGVIYSNAALHWLPDHDALFPRLVGFLAEGGVLAVQMPRQQHAPSHSLLRDLAQDMFPERFDFRGWNPQVSEPERYVALLSPHGTLNLWETEYFQRLEGSAIGHPVRAFTQSTAMRPFRERMTDAEYARFEMAYDAALGRAYPPSADGSVCFPFRRLFLVLQKGK